MHGGGLDTMAMPLLPMWVRIASAVALCAVVVAHVGHAWARPGQRRWWHVGHIAMAAGMALMYTLPAMTHAVGYRVGLALYSLAAVTLAAVTVVLRRREGAVNPLWLFLGLDMLAMTYMLVPSPARPTWLTVLVVVYPAGQVVSWGLGWWDRLPVLSPRAAGAPSVTTGGSSSRQRGHEHALLFAAPAVAIKPDRMVGLTMHPSVAVRLTLAVMAASMAYMLAAM